MEEIPQKIGLMRKIISQFKNHLSTEASQLQPGSETLKNYILQLRVIIFIPKIYRFIN
jgi:hypothetical protein